MQALVVRTDGTLEVKKLKGWEQYAREVGTGAEQKQGKLPYVERLAYRKGYRNPGDRRGVRRHLSCYVDEEGALKQLPSNPYAALFAALNLALYAGIFVFGNVVVLSFDPDSGKDCTVLDQYVVELFERYRNAGVGTDEDGNSGDDSGASSVDEFDEDAFFMALEALDKDGDASEEHDAAESGGKKKRAEDNDDTKKKKKKGESTKKRKTANNTNG